MRRLSGFALLGMLLASCVPQSTPQPTTTPTARATADRPRFELATYMYALQTRGKIRIAVLDADPPFASTDATGTRSGFEIDLGRELAKAIFGQQQAPDRVIEWISVDRSTAVSALSSAQADVAIARIVRPPTTSVDQTPVDYTDRYLVTGERILVRADNADIKEVPDLDSKTVCVVSESVAEHVVDANAFAKTLALDTYASCLQALQQAQVDAIAADEAALWGLLKQDAKTMLVGRHLTTEEYTIGVKATAAADREGFLPFLDAWLAGAIRDGTWARLYAQDITPVSRETRTAP